MPEHDEHAHRQGAPPRRPPSERAPSLRSILKGAQQAVELTGKDLEGIVGVSRDGDRWTVRIELVELRRIPSTTDVLAVYEVELDQSANLIGYRRLERYVRGSPGEDRS